MRATAVKNRLPEKHSYDKLIQKTTKTNEKGAIQPLLSLTQIVFAYMQ